jgi:uridylate kinase
MCRDNDVEMRVFGMNEPGNVTRALVGEKIGTLLTTS